MSAIMRVLGSTLFAVLLASQLCGCVGPNYLKRRLDQNANQRYVSSPLHAELLFPVALIENHVAVLIDLCCINPYYWWRDVFRGHGTPYLYQNPKLPAEPETRESDGS